MRRLFLLLTVLLAGLFPGFALGGPIHTSVIPSTGTALTINVGAGRLLKIFEFVHDGGVGTAVLTKGTQSSTFMQSIPATSPEQHGSFTVAGAATVKIDPPASGALTLTFQLVDNTD